MEQISRKSERFIWSQENKLIPPPCNLLQNDELTGSLTIVGNKTVQIETNDGAWECAGDGFRTDYDVISLSDREHVGNFKPKMFLPWGRRSAGILTLQSGDTYSWVTNGVFSNEYQWENSEKVSLLSFKNPWLITMLKITQGTILSLETCFTDPNWSILLAVGWFNAWVETRRSW